MDAPSLAKPTSVPPSGAPVRAGREGGAGALARALVTLALVMTAATASLEGLGALPRLLTEPAEGRLYSSVADLERRLRQRLLLPAYFPQSLAWPPKVVRATGGRPAVVVLEFQSRESAGPALYLAQTIGGAAEIPEHMLPQATKVEEGPLKVGKLEGRLTLLRGGDGEVWHQLTWEQNGSRLALRGSGGLGQLLRMAGSVRKEGP